MKKLLTIFAIAFVLNLFWENAQAPLFQGYESFWQHLWICLPASIWDAGYITLVYFVLFLLPHTKSMKHFLPDQEKSVSRIALILVVIVLGFVTAGYIELRALAQGRWAYTDAMPLVPFTTIGLLPFLQLAVLSLLTYTVVDLRVPPLKISHRLWRGPASLENNSGGEGARGSYESENL